MGRVLGWFVVLCIIAWVITDPGNAGSFVHSAVTAIFAFVNGLRGVATPVGAIDAVSPLMLY